MILDNLKLDGKSRSSPAPAAAWAARWRCGSPGRAPTWSPRRARSAIRGDRGRGPRARAQVPDRADRRHRAPNRSTRWRRRRSRNRPDRHPDQQRRRQATDTRQDSYRDNRRGVAPRNRHQPLRPVLRMPRGDHRRCSSRKRGKIINIASGYGSARRQAQLHVRLLQGRACSSLTRSMALTYAAVQHPDQLHSARHLSAQRSGLMAFFEGGKFIPIGRVGEDAELGPLAMFLVPDASNHRQRRTHYDRRRRPGRRHHAHRRRAAAEIG